MCKPFTSSWRVVPPAPWANTANALNAENGDNRKLWPDKFACACKTNWRQDKMLSDWIYLEWTKILLTSYRLAENFISPTDNSFARISIDVVANTSTVIANLFWVDHIFSNKKFFLENYRLSPFCGKTTMCEGRSLLYNWNWLSCKALYIHSFQTFCVQ